MYEATKLLSSSSSPTQEDLRLTFLEMLSFLRQQRQQSDQQNIINAIYNKLEIYWIRNLSSSSSISAILDPRYKFTTFNDSTEHNDCIDHLKSLFSSYITNSHIIPNRTSERTLQSSRNYFLNMINNNQVYSSAETPEFDEINSYLNTSNDINTDPLIWWKEHQDEFPILSLIAKDYLIIQATSVAAEQAFSIAGNTITPNRNRLEPQTTRASLCLKSWIENKIGIINNINNENHEIGSDSNSSNSDDNYSNGNRNSIDSNSTDSDSNSDSN
jgi:hypothetical protein